MRSMIALLPAGLADPLHLMQPWPWRRLIAVALLSLLLAFLIWRRKRREAASATAPPAPPAVSPPTGFAAAVRELRGRAVEHKDFRRACHDLATLAREFLEKERHPRFGAHRYSVLTAGEIRSALGESPVARLFGLLSDLQFGRRTPRRSDFDEACDLALEEVAAP